jgi:hypothetical protein
LFKEVDAAFGELGTPSSRETKGRLDLAEEIQELWVEVEGTARLFAIDSPVARHLTSDYQGRKDYHERVFASDDEVQST